MSSFSIQPVAPFPINQSAMPVTTTAAPAQSVPAATESHDTVKLTASKQAEAMYQSGESVSSISSSLGISESMVDSYLGITPTVSVPTTVSAHGAHAAASTQASAGTTDQSTASAGSAARPAPAKVDIKA